jgi:hypothetical protein
VQERTEAQRASAGQAVGQRLGEQRAGRRRELLPHRRGRIRLEGDRGAEHLERVPVDVAVVVVALLHAAQCGDLREHRPGEPEIVHERHPLDDGGRGDDAAQLGEDPLLGDARDRGGVRARGRGGVRVDREAQLDGQARQAQRTQRVGGEGVRRDHPQAPALEVVEAAVQVDQRPTVQRLGQRVDGDVPRREVGLQRAAVQRREIDLPGLAAAHHAPRAERLGQLEGRGALGLRQRARRPADVAVHHDVEVGRAGGIDAVQQAVADGAAHEPGAALTGGLPHRGEQRVGLAHPATRSPSR